MTKHSPETYGFQVLTATQVTGPFTAVSSVADLRTLLASDPGIIVKLQMQAEACCLEASTEGAMEWLADHLDQVVLLSPAGKGYVLLENDFRHDLGEDYSKQLEAALPGLGFLRGDKRELLIDDSEALANALSIGMASLTETLDKLHASLDVKTPFHFKVGNMISRASRIVLLDSKGNETELSGRPARVRAQTRDMDSQAVGVLVEFTDAQGHPRSIFIENKQFAQPQVLATTFMDEGGEWFGKSTSLKEFFQKQKSSHLIHTTKAPGFVEVPGQSGQWVYVNQDASGNPMALNGMIDDVRFISSPGVNNPGLYVGGSKEGWIEHVYRSIKPYPLALAVIALGLGSTLLGRLDLSGGGFHFFGKSSKGKTTLLQIGASLFGNGIDPAWASGSVIPYVKGLHSSKNGLEALADGHIDVLLPLDELGAYEGTNFGEIIYMLATGRGKTRMTAQRTRDATATWRTLTLSTGEFSIAQLMLRNKQPLMEGMEGRMADVSLMEDDIIFKGCPGDPAELAERLKANCANHYGWIGREFMTRVAYEWCDRDAFRQDFEPIRERLLFPGIKSHQRRVVDRLAAAEYAGCLAAAWNMLPDTSQEEIQAAIRYLRDLWLQTPPQGRLAGFEAFYEENYDAFVPIPQYPPLPSAPGFWDYKRGLLLISKSVFKQEFQPEHMRMLDELEGKDWLHKDRGGRNKTTRFKVGAEEHTAYAITFEALRKYQHLTPPPEPPKSPAPNKRVSLDEAVFD
jgi:hypothetical protein